LKTQNVQIEHFKPNWLKKTFAKKKWFPVFSSGSNPLLTEKLGAADDRMAP
jgi:hypothetical protein